MSSKAQLEKNNKFDLKDLSNLRNDADKLRSERKRSKEETKPVENPDYCVDNADHGTKGKATGSTGETEDLSESEGPKDLEKQDYISKEESEFSLEKDVNYNSVGRRGDPRMNRAVAARRANPNMSLLEALLEGGFQFPNICDSNRKSDRYLYDSDNVLLSQRKNQLSRRLRLAKRKYHKMRSDLDSFARANHFDESSNLHKSSSLSADLARNPAEKRSSSGQTSDDHTVTARLKISDNDYVDKICTLPASAISELSLAQISLQQQQQQGLFGQSQTQLDVSPLLLAHQQDLSHPLIQNQVLQTFGNPGINPSLYNGQLQTITQNQIDNYLSEAAIALYLERLAPSLSQPNLPIAGSHLLYQSLHQLPSAMSTNPSIQSVTDSNLLIQQYLILSRLPGNQIQGQNCDSNVREVTNLVRPGVSECVPEQTLSSPALQHDSTDI